jgi:hypothetical protein
MESRSRPAGIRVHDALEAANTMRRNMHFVIVIEHGVCASPGKTYQSFTEPLTYRKCLLLLQGDRIDLSAIANRPLHVINME